MILTGWPVPSPAAACVPIRPSISWQTPPTKTLIARACYFALPAILMRRAAKRARGPGGDTPSRISPACAHQTNGNGVSAAVTVLCSEAAETFVQGSGRIYMVVWEPAFRRTDATFPPPARRWRFQQLQTHAGVKTELIFVACLSAETNTHNSAHQTKYTLTVNLHPMGTSLQCRWPVPLRTRARYGISLC